jgi:phosphoglycolate phosphatase-like HAD superfamily hydrolase
MQSTADALGLPKPSGSQIADEYHRPFFQHLTWFFGDDEQRVVDTYMGFYQQWVNTVGHLYPGVVKTLETLKHRGYQIAVFSDKRKQFGELEVEQAGLGHLLDYTLFLVDGRPYKPDPYGLLHVLEELSVPKDQAVYVGDGSHDLECARRAGIAGGAALWGALNREDLLNGHPDHSWETVDQLLLSLE